MKNHFDVVTVGGATRDITFYTNEGKLISNPSDPLRQKLLGFEYGAKIGIREAFFTFGGGAANAAVCFSRLGLKTGAIIKVGDDEDGRAVIGNLKKNKIITDFVKISKDSKTGFSFIINFRSGDERTAFLHRGANDELEIGNNELNKLKTDWFYISSLSGEGWNKVLDRIIFQGVKIAWNPGNRQLSAGILGLKKYLIKTKILLVNKDEAVELVFSLKKYKNAETKWLNQPKNLFKVLSEFCPNILVITDGAKGAYAWENGKFYYQKSLSKKIVDTTGAGDSFCASFSAGYGFYGGDIRKSLKLGAINSAKNLTGVGAQEPLITRKEAEKKIGL